MNLKARIVQIYNDVSTLGTDNSLNIGFLLCKLGHTSKYNLRLNGDLKNYELLLKENNEFVTDDIEEMKRLAKDDEGLQRIIDIITGQL